MKNIIVKVVLYKNKLLYHSVLNNNIIILKRVVINYNDFYMQNCL